MKGHLAKVLTFTCCLFGSGYAYAGDEPVIRVLCYNIHHGEGMDGEIDLGRIADVIKSVSPDIVSLQEVDKQTQRTHRVDQAKELARLAGMQYVYGASLPFQGGEYGNAVLTRHRIRESVTVPLPGEPRSALCVTLSLPTGDSTTTDTLFIATHLDTKQTPRYQSVPLIEQALASLPQIPSILAGDLNALPDSPTMQEFGRTWVNTTSGDGFFTYPVDVPTKQIDYILHRPAESWQVLETQVLDEAIASDHRPILAVLQLLP